MAEADDEKAITLQNAANENRYQNATKTLPKRLRYASMANAETLQNNAETLQYRWNAAKRYQYADKCCFKIQ